MPGNDRRVAITGMGPVTPIGTGRESFWNALVEGISGIDRLTAFDPSRFDAQIGGKTKNTRIADVIPKSYRKSAKVMACDIEIAVIAAYHAVKDAGLVTKCLIDRGEAAGPPTVDPPRLGANIGAGLICADLNELAGALATAVHEDNKFSLKLWGRQGMENLTPLWLLKFLPNMLACHVTIVHDCQGASNTITCGEASSHLAIGEAFRTIARGDADVCICGGAESKINPMGLMRQSLLKRLATTHNDRPQEACRPFDAEHCGSVISEGGGLLILEELEHAQARGARLYGELIGFGAASDSHALHGPPPDGRGLASAIRKALADAGAAPEQIDVVGAFGTGIPAYDDSETQALVTALGPRAEQVPVMAIKGAVGNNGAGSGAVDLAALLCAMHHNLLPANRNVNHPAKGCPLQVVRPHPQDAKLELALSVGYALAGGQTAALVIRKVG